MLPVGAALISVMPNQWLETGLVEGPERSGIGWILGRFDLTSLGFVVHHDVLVFEIASFEMIDCPSDPLLCSPVGPGSGFCVKPDDMRRFFFDVRQAHVAPCRACFGPSPHEEADLPLRQSLRDIAEAAPDEPITSTNVRSIHPTGGLPPDDFDQVVGKVASNAIKLGEPITHYDQGAGHE